MSSRPVFGLVLGALTAATLSTAARADFLGVTMTSDAVRIDASTGVQTFVGNCGHVGFNSMARDPAGRFVVANQPGSENPHLLYVDPLFGSALAFQFSWQNSVRAMGFSPAGVLYTIDHFGAQSNLYTLDLPGPFADPIIRHFIGQCTFQGIQGMTFAADGTLYGWDVSAGLVVIDPATAVTTDVNGTFDGTSMIQTIAFAPDGTLYAAGDHFYTVNRTTGAYTQIGTSTFTPTVTGMEYIDYSAPFPY